MQGNAPGMGYGPPGGNPQVHPQMEPAAVPQGHQYAPPPKRTSRLATVLGLVAVLLAAAALVVSLVKKPEVQTPAQPAPMNSAPGQVFNADADRALCQAVAPLMRENEEQGKKFSALEAGSPEQARAIPGYRTFVEDWARRTQEVLNKYAKPPRYLTRTLQQFIDDKLLYVEMVQPGRVDKFDAPTWQQGAIDYGGPLGTCRDVGVTW